VALELAAPRVVCFATKGSGSNEEERIVQLLEALRPEVYPFDRDKKLVNIPRLLGLVRKRRPDLLVMEGTGLAGGLALMAARLLLGTPFVFSSGDAVGPFLAGRRRALALPAWVYETLLYRLSAGFIGWTPYLAGRALTLGSPRVMTAAHFAADPEVKLARGEVRRRLGIPDDVIVAGIIGNLAWNPRYGYCYGLELMKAMARVRRPDVAVVVIGHGTGAEHLKQLAGDDLGRRIFLPGPVDADLVVSYLAAMDIGSLPQSLDQAGAFRYTTKLPEYMAARLPVVTGEIPAAYDLMADWSWRLPGDAPWDDRYIDALADLLERVQPGDIAQRRAAIPAETGIFTQAEQQRRAAAFVLDVVDRESHRTALARATTSA
jgi:hypothetical protein